MTATRVVRVLILVLLFAPSLLAAEDLSGKWSGTFVNTTDGGATQEHAAQMVAKHSGAEFTGTIGPGADQQWPILKGKVQTVKESGKETTKLSFDVQTADSNNLLIHFELSLVDGHLKGTASAEQDGHTMTAAVDLARMK